MSLTVINIQDTAIVVYTQLSIEFYGYCSKELADIIIILNEEVVIIFNFALYLMMKLLK